MWTQLITWQLEDAYLSADALMERVGDRDLDWRPAEDNNWMRLDQLLLHTATACGRPMRGFVTGVWPDDSRTRPDDLLPPAERMPAATDLAAARDALAADQMVARKAVEDAGEEALAHRMTVAPWRPGVERPLGFWLLAMVRHLESHKQQLFSYLKLLGEPVDTHDLWVGRRPS